MRRPLPPASGPAPRRLDLAGIVLSGLCAVHCLAGLVLVGMLGIGGAVLLDPAIHRTGLALAIAIGVLTIGANALRHRHRGPLALGVAGIALMAGAMAAPHGSGEALLTIAGVSLLASAHALNLRRARAGCC